VAKALEQGKLADLTGLLYSYSMLISRSHNSMLHIMPVPVLLGNLLDAGLLLKGSNETTGGRIMLASIS
jgi:hypothetical protein